MGRPAKQGTRRQVRLPDSLWQEIDQLALSHDTEYSQVLHIAYNLGKVHPNFREELSQNSTSLCWEKIKALPYLDTLRSIIAAGGSLNLKQIEPHGTSVALVSATAYRTWVDLSEALEVNLDTWLLSRVFSGAPLEIRQAAEREDLFLEKENQKWFLRIVRNSKKLTNEVNSLVEQKKLLPRDDLNTGRYEIVRD